MTMTMTMTMTIIIIIIITVIPFSSGLLWAWQNELCHTESIRLWWWFDVWLSEICLVWVRFYTTTQPLQEHVWIT